MGKWSSSLSVAFARRPIDAKIGLHDRSGHHASSPSSFDLKEIQRRAFERGRLVEREQSGVPLQVLVRKLSDYVATLEQSRVADSQRVEEVGVRLGLHVAEQLTRKVLADNEHDSRALVETAISEIRARKETGPLTIELATGDHSRLLDAFAGRKPKGIELRENASLSPGDFVIQGNNVEYWSSMNERLEALRTRLIEESRDV
ncbi:MAG: FliH/SctL family protein [Planctomycetota bacterium]